MVCKHILVTEGFSQAKTERNLAYGLANYYLYGTFMEIIHSVDLTLSYIFGKRQF